MQVAIAQLMSKPVPNLLVTARSGIDGAVTDPAHAGPSSMLIEITAREAYSSRRRL